MHALETHADLWVDPQNAKRGLYRRTIFGDTGSGYPHARGSRNFGAKKVARKGKGDPIWTLGDDRGPPVGAKKATRGAVEPVLNPQKAGEGSSVKHLSESKVPATCG